jgi:hypothetical protein
MKESTSLREKEMNFFLVDYRKVLNNPTQLEHVL